MKLHQIIEANEQDGKSILLEAMQPYFKSLRTYYKRSYGCEPTLMITSVSNSFQNLVIKKIVRIFVTTNI